MISITYIIYEGVFSNIQEDFIILLYSYTFLLFNHDLVFYAISI